MLSALFCAVSRGGAGGGGLEVYGKKKLTGHKGQEKHIEDVNW